MKTSHILTLGAALTVGAWGMAQAADTDMESKPKPGVMEAASATVTGTVEAIDYQTRMITLKEANGNQISMEVGPEATRFNEVKKGDVVKISYLESIALVVASPSENVGSAEASGTVMVRNKTKKPSATAVETKVATATVEKIDAKKRKAVLKTPDGETFPIDVAPDVPHLENVKKGDQVTVKYTRSLAVSVSKP